jgi:osmotically inducible protein OsmC
MVVRHASAVWERTLKDGNGKMTLGSGAFKGTYSFASRFENGKGKNPEELIGAAHAGCFSMIFAHRLAEAGYSPEWVQTRANVQLDKVDEGFRITGIKLTTVAKVPDIDEKTFLEQAMIVKNTCPVSQALTGVGITILAKLLD